MVEIAVDSTAAQCRGIPGQNAVRIRVVPETLLITGITRQERCRSWKRCQRIEDTNRRIDELRQDIGQRLEELRQTLLWGLGVTFAGMFALIGFVIWDRRSTRAPTVRQMEGLREREEKLEAALREYARQAPALAESLRKMGLL